MQHFMPNAGKYRKINVYARPLDGSAMLYLHSTNAYDTLQHAVIGALLFAEIIYIDNKKRYVYTVSDGFGCSKIAIDPYSIIAEFDKR